MFYKTDECPGDIQARTAKRQEEGEWGGLTHYDYGFRIYNPGIGKFLSVDPLAAAYPMLTSYQVASNRPIDGVDLDGLEYRNSTLHDIMNQRTILQLRKKGNEEGARAIESATAGSRMGVTVGGVIVGGTILASTVSIGGTAMYLYTNPEAFSLVTATAWGLGTDQDLPGFGGDDLMRGIRHVTKEYLEEVLKKVNFNEAGLIRSLKNCPSCVEVGDATLNGKLAEALYDKAIHGKHIVSQKPSVVARMFNRKFVYRNVTAESISEIMTDLGDGATGVIMGYRRNVLTGNVEGHTFNVVNINGEIFFPDFQVGKLKSIDQVNSYGMNMMFFPTNKSNVENSLMNRFNRWWKNTFGDKPHMITPEKLEETDF